MKRIVICLFIIAALIVLGAASFYYTDSVTGSAAHTIDEIAGSFETGDFEQARSLTMTLSQRWGEYVKNDIFIVDKDHIMEITAMIARLQALAEEKSEDLPEECAAARQMILFYREKNYPTWNNIF